MSEKRMMGEVLNRGFIISLHFEIYLFNVQGGSQ